jgi:hypothetical protein
MLTKKVKDGDESISLSDQMYCYCKKLTNGGKDFWYASKVSFEVSKVEIADETSYCWLYIRESIVSTILLKCASAITAIINSAIAFIFVFLGVF